LWCQVGKAKEKEKDSCILVLKNLNKKDIVNMVQQQMTG
jgi:hypothetical protein